MLRDKFRSYLITIDLFRKDECDFQYLRRYLNGTGMYELGKELNFNGRDLYITIDNWFEYIEFCYREEDWRVLALSICDFVEDAILSEPKPLTLPEDDRVVREQGLA